MLEEASRSVELSADTWAWASENLRSLPRESFQVHDALCAVSRTLESNAVVPGGGAVETSLSLHLEDGRRPEASDAG